MVSSSVKFLPADRIVVRFGKEAGARAFEHAKMGDARRGGDVQGRDDRARRASRCRAASWDATAASPSARRRSAPGEEVIVCLGAQAPALPYVLGLSQGVFRVRRDAASGPARGDDARPARERRRRPRVQRGDPARRPMSVGPVRGDAPLGAVGAQMPRREPARARHQRRSSSNGRGDA